MGLVVSPRPFTFLALPSLSSLTWEITASKELLVRITSLLSMLVVRTEGISTFWTGHWKFSHFGGINWFKSAAKS